MERSGMIEELEKETLREVNGLHERRSGCRLWLRRSHHHTSREPDGVGQDFGRIASEGSLDVHLPAHL